jgi:F420-dependent oxidoreductase-like protein
MFIGSQLHANATSWGRVAETVRCMDDGPWHSAWVPDHFVPPLDFLDEADDNFEGWTLLTAMAAITERVRLGVLVAGNTYRDPALLAKMAATLDHVSNGRLEFGIGAGWHVREHEAYGWYFPPLKERSDRLEEACELIKALFTADGPIDYKGQYYHLDAAPFAPGCVQQPHVPIMVGGGGEKRTLRTLALYGDTLNVSGSTAVVQHKIEVLEAHCEKIGRDPATITKTVMLPVGLQDDEVKAERLRDLWGGGRTDEERAALPFGPAAKVIESLGTYASIGVDGVIFQGLPNNPGVYQRLADEVIPTLA